MLSSPVTLESFVRAFESFHELFQALALYDTATARVLNNEEKQEAVNGFLDTGMPRNVFFSLPGLGDSILLTAVARHAREQTGERCLVASRHAALFHGSQDVSHVILNYDLLHPSPYFTDFLIQLDLLPVFVAYGVRRMVNGRRAIASPDCHMITHMCRMAGLHGRVALRPWINTMSSGALPRLPKGREYVVFQSDGTPWKHWGNANFQAVAHALRKRFFLIQTGVFSEEPGLEDVLDLRGKLNLAESVSLMAGARLFIGNEGGLAHLARAVDTQGVIAASSFTDLSLTGYAANVILAPERPCRLCSTGHIKIYKGEPCPENHRCVDISVDSVLEGVEKALENPAMHVEFQTIPEPVARYNPTARNVFEQWLAE